MVKGIRGGQDHSSINIIEAAMHTVEKLKSSSIYCVNTLISETCLDVLCVWPTSSSRSTDDNVIVEKQLTRYVYLISCL